MKIISHRGNLNGRNLDLENNPFHIQNLLKKVDCEIDVWLIKDDLFLGHDLPEYKINLSFLKQSGLWCHAKNLDALNFMLDEGITCFYHNIDSFTLTSNKYIWTFPNQPICDKSIIVDTGIDWHNKNYNCYGICVDYIDMENIKTN